MDIQECRQFIEVWGKTSNDLLYLTKQGDQYLPVANKSDKNLNTKEITKLAKKCWQFLCLDVESEKTDRRKILKQLQGSLKQYQTRIEAAKPWYKKIWDYLGIVSPEEQKIKELDDKLSALSNLYNYHPDPSFKRKNFEQRSTEEKLKEFYHQVLGFSPLNEYSLEGCDIFYVNKLFIEQLEKFKGLCCKLEELNQIDQVIQDLSYLDKAQFVVDVTYLHVLKARFGFLGSAIADSLLERLIVDFYSKIEQMPIGSHLLLPGGYTGKLNQVVIRDKKEPQSFGHRVLYEVKKELEGTYSFRIINTGEGVGHLNALKTIFGIKIQDLAYTNLSIKDLSSSFIRQLLKYQITTTGPKLGASSMSKVNTYIHKRLKKGANQTYQGKKHRLQRKGVCTVKSLSSWLHGELEEPLYWRFKTFIAEEHLKSLQEIKANHIKELAVGLNFERATVKKLIRVMQKEGKKVLKRRKQKVISSSKLD